ncbi:MAG: WavE lipopolysaccharide synthesis family protein [Endomicrobiia bacterium]
MFDLVIQGNLVAESPSFISYYAKETIFNKVILSTWEGEKDELIQSIRRDCPNVEIIQSVKPYAGMGNRNLQICSSLAGVKEAESDYVIKVRSDMLIDFKLIYNFFFDNWKENNIYTLSVYSKYAFHPRDHVFIGKREDLIRLFDIPYDLTPISSYPQSIHSIVRTETYIGVHYYKHLSDDIEKFIEKPYLYLTDSSSCRQEALSRYYSFILNRQGFLPLPMIPIFWPKYYPNGYPFLYLKKAEGEVYHEDLQSGMWL